MELEMDARAARVFVGLYHNLPLFSRERRNEQQNDTIVLLDNI